MQSNTVQFRNLKGEKFSLVMSSDVITVYDMKKKLQQDFGYDSDSLKILLKGQVLENDNKIQSLNISPQDLLTILVSKKVIVQVSQKNTDTKHDPTKQKIVENTKPDPMNNPKIVEIMQMGFTDLDLIQNALKAANNDTQKAVEFLLSGNIPQIESNNQVSESQRKKYNPILKNLAKTIDLEKLRNDIFQNPYLLDQLLINTAQKEPYLYQAIAEDPEAFRALLLEGPSPELLKQSSSQVDEYQENNNNWIGQDEIDIKVTPEEKIVLDELLQLGFKKADTLEAFLVSDRDKDKALEYLLNNPDLLSKHMKQEEEKVQQQALQNQQQNQNVNDPNKPSDNLDDELYGENNGNQNNSQKEKQYDLDEELYGDSNQNQVNYNNTNINSNQNKEYDLDEELYGGNSSSQANANQDQGKMQEEEIQLNINQQNINSSQSKQLSDIQQVDKIDNLKVEQMNQKPVEKKNQGNNDDDDDIYK